MKRRSFLASVAAFLVSPFAERPAKAVTYQYSDTMLVMRKPKLQGRKQFFVVWDEHGAYVEQMDSVFARKRPSVDDGLEIDWIEAP